MRKIVIEPVQNEAMFVKETRNQYPPAMATCQTKIFLHPRHGTQETIAGHTLKGWAVSC
jgi:hypothetical protein